MCHYESPAPQFQREPEALDEKPMQFEIAVNAVLRWRVRDREFLAGPIAMLRNRLDEFRGDFLRVALFLDDERWVGAAVLSLGHIRGWNGGGADQFHTCAGRGDCFAMLVHFVQEME